MNIKAYILLLNGALWAGPVKVKHTVYLKIEKGCRPPVLDQCTCLSRISNKYINYFRYQGIDKSQVGKRLSYESKVGRGSSTCNIHDPRSDLETEITGSIIKLQTLFAATIFSKMLNLIVGSEVKLVCLALASQG